MGCLQKSRPLVSKHKSKRRYLSRRSPFREDRGEQKTLVAASRCWHPGDLCSRAGAVNTCRRQDLEQWQIVSNVYPFLPKLTMNGQFIRDFIAADSPCFALGLVEERKRQCGFLALRPDEVIPPEISAVGFNFGHALLGTTEFEVIQFVFYFYGFETYNVLVNPNNHLVRGC